MDHSLTLAIALIWAISVFLWTGRPEERRGVHRHALIARAGIPFHDPLPCWSDAGVQKAKLRSVKATQKAASGGPADVSSEASTRRPYELLATRRSTSRWSRGLSAIGPGR